MAADAEQYLSVLKASYDYDSQSDDEISIKEGQLLFLLDKVDDDWWKVKMKADPQDEDSPCGLVPAAYVEQAEHSSIVKALYFYEAAAPGELTVHEDEILLVFDTEQDWLLAQSQKEGGGAGFVPANYVELYTEDQATAPPQIVVPPSAPRPTSIYVDPADRVASTKVNADGIQTWSVSEIDKKGKKKKGTLGIGNGALFFASEADKTPVQKWKVQDVVGASVEKQKHVLIEIGGATPISLHFHTGSKDNMEAIITKLDSSKALSDSRDSFDVPEVPDAAPSTRESKKPTVHFSNSSPDIIPAAKGDVEYEEPDTGPPADTVDLQSETETGIALYDFTADGDDELSVVEGEKFVILEKDGDEWWKCRNSKGAVGVVPASYIEISDASETVHSLVLSQDQQEEDRSADEEHLRQEKEHLVREQEEDRERVHRKADAERQAGVVAAVEKKKRKETNAKRGSTSAEPKRSISENGGASSVRVSVENHRPPPNSTRIWHDRTGQFRVEAAFLGFHDGKLRLHKVNGVIVEVPREKMSLDDLEFAERLANKKSQPSALRRVSEDDVPLAQVKQLTVVQQSTRLAPSPRKASNIDWFDFFLSAGCDVDDCTRYASAFERDKIDESILPDITESIMRSLGVREGDIIRIAKAIEKRKPTDNLIKPSRHTEEQIRRDEELARQLQAQESSITRAPAPNLFAGPGGILKNPRRGRPQPSKSLPPASVDINAISTASENLQRTSSPQLLTPSTATTSSPVHGPPRSDSTLSTNKFENDAWTNRPSSTKPVVGTPTPRTPSVPPVPNTVPNPSLTPSLVIPVSPAPASQAAPSSAPASQAAPNPAPVTAPSAPSVSSNPLSLARTTESDIFDQLARLGELRKQTPAAQTPPVPVPQSASPPIIPMSYQTGLGMGSSPASISQHLQNLQLNTASQQPSQLLSGPRGPFAPVPANQSLLQPLIPTQTGFNSFIPTRPISANSSLAVSPFRNPPQTSFTVSHPPTLPAITSQPILSQPTGLPFNGLNQGQNNGPFPPIQPQYTSFNTGFAHSPFNNGMSAPVLPSLPASLPSSPSIVTKDTSPANVFAQMKSGTFANENATNTQPLPLTSQPTGWVQSYQGGFMGYQR